MPCPNCGFVSAPGTMFCGKCGTRLAAAPAQPAPYTPQQPTSQPYGGTYAPSQQPAAQPYGGTYSPQRTAYTPPAEHTSYAPPAAEPVARPIYPSYSASMMQSPYISGASRASVPVLSSSREGAAQYTAVSTNVYSPQAKAAVVASEQATKKKKAGKVIMTIFAILLLAAMGGLLYYSGIFKQADNSIYVPDDSGDTQTSVTVPSKPAPAVSGSDSDNEPVVSPGITSDTDAETAPSKPSEPVVSAPSVPGGLNANRFAELNAFVSAFTETGTTNISGSVSPETLVQFAVSGLSINSSVFEYDSEGFSSGDVIYNYSISEKLVNQRIGRYFGESVQIYPAIGDSGDGWMYYGSSYYFTEVAQSKGFAIVTDYSENGDMINVKFNIYAPMDNEAQYYSMIAKDAESAGCKLAGTGSATLGKTTYNGRDTYIISSITANLN